MNVNSKRTGICGFFPSCKDMRMKSILFKALD